MLRQLIHKKVWQVIRAMVLSLIWVCAYTAIGQPTFAIANATSQLFKKGFAGLWAKDVAGVDDKGLDGVVATGYPSSVLYMRLIEGGAQQLIIQLPSELPASSKVSIRAYHNGIRTKAWPLTLDTLTKIATYEASGKQGYFELLIEEYNPMPFVLNGQAKLVIKPTLEQLKGYTVAGSDPDNQALALFLGYSMQRSAWLATLQETLKAEQASGNKDALTHFVTGFVAAYADMQAGMGELRRQYPGTYAARYLASFYAAPLSLSDSLGATLTHIRRHFFDGWNLTAPESAANPFILNELENYYTHFAQQNGELHTGITTLLGRADLKEKPQLTESLIDMVSLVLLKNHHPKAEEYALYMGETYGNVCGTTASGSTDRASIPIRMQRMKAGAQFPVLQLQSLTTDNRLSLNQQWVKQPYTLLFFWQTTCPYCADMLPAVEQWTAKQSRQLQAIAVALDRQRTDVVTHLDSLKQAGRKHAQNWTECWEPGELTNEQLARIYINHTPTLVLLNQQGQVITTGRTLEDIQRSIPSDNP